jgi:hypothetical protein
MERFEVLTVVSVLECLGSLQARGAPPQPPICTVFSSGVPQSLNQIVSPNDHIIQSGRVYAGYNSNPVTLANEVFCDLLRRSGSNIGPCYSSIPGPLDVTPAEYSLTIQGTFGADVTYGTHPTDHQERVLVNNVVLHRG